MARVVEGQPLLFLAGDRACLSGGNLGARGAEREEMFVYLVDAWKERAMLGGRRKLAVQGVWSTVRELKASIARLLRIPVSQQRLYWRSWELQDHRSLEESGIHRSGETVLFDARATGEVADHPEKATLEPVSCTSLHRWNDGELPSALGRAFLKARRALVVGAKAPALAMDGTGGTYFLHGLDGLAVGCFKPADEEPFCVNNPRHFVGPHGRASSRRSRSSSSSRRLLSAAAVAAEAEGMRRGIRPGEAHAREVAAYLLDRAARSVAGVPETTLAESRHAKYRYADRAVAEKLGSFQVYVPHEGIAEDYGPDSFDAARLQAIAVFDMRALNCDRNAANLLVRRKKNIEAKRHQASPVLFSSSSSSSSSGTPTTGKFDVVPIDHGYILPDLLEIEWFDWCWIDWPAVRAPLDEAVERHIEALDPAADAAMLRDSLGMRAPCLRLMRAATDLLKRGVRAGLTLRDVASLMVPSRRDSEKHAGSSSHKPRARLRIAVQHAEELANLVLAEERTGPRRFPLVEHHRMLLMNRDHGGSSSSNNNKKNNKSNKNRNSNALLADPDAKPSQPNATTAPVAPAPGTATNNNIHGLRISIVDENAQRSEALERLSKEKDERPKKPKRVSSGLHLSLLAADADGARRLLEAPTTSNLGASLAAAAALATNDFKMTLSSSESSEDGAAVVTLDDDGHHHHHHHHRAAAAPAGGATLSSSALYRARRQGTRWDDVTPGASFDEVPSPKSLSSSNMGSPRWVDGLPHMVEAGGSVASLSESFNSLSSSYSSSMDESAGSLDARWRAVARGTRLQKTPRRSPLAAAGGHHHQHHRHHHRQQPPPPPLEIRAGADAVAKYMATRKKTARNEGGPLVRTIPLENGDDLLADDVAPPSFAPSSPRYFDPSRSLPSRAPTKAPPPMPMLDDDDDDNNNDDDGAVDEAKESSPPPPPPPPRMTLLTAAAASSASLEAGSSRPSPTPITARSLEGSPLIRLHSCPSLADAGSFALNARPNKGAPLESTDGGAASPPEPKTRCLVDRKPGQKLVKDTSFDEAAYDAHFFRFLDGLLDDLIRWKVAANKAAQRAQEKVLAVKEEDLVLGGPKRRGVNLGLEETLESSALAGC